MSILHKLEWSYQTEMFDAQKMIPEEELTELLSAMNLAQSSWELQPYSFIVVHDPLLQKELAAVTHGHHQITEASHLVIIVAMKELSPSYIKKHVLQKAEASKQSYESLKDYEDTLLSFSQGTSKSDLLLWAQKEAYLALATLLVAAADLKIDTRLIESFDARKYDELLGIEGQKTTTSAVVALGYRHPQDKAASYKRARKRLNEIVDLRYGK